jgi:uncharacterized SAM-binding protein YcdF (DUF218 family)
MLRGHMSKRAIEWLGIAVVFCIVLAAELLWPQSFTMAVRFFAVCIFAFLGPFALLWPEKFRKFWSRRRFMDPDARLSQIRIAAMAVTILVPLAVAWRYGGLVDWLRHLI